MAAFRFSVIANDATYDITSNLATINEGNTITITLNTAGVQNYQPLPYTITGDGITVDDFVGRTKLTGFILIYGNTGQVVLPLALDYDYENKETFTVTMDDSGVSVTVDVKNIMPGAWWDANNSEEAAVWDLGRAPWGASYWDV